MNPDVELTVNVCEGAECTARAVASLLDIIAFGAFVYLRVELLLSPSVAISA